MAAAAQRGYPNPVGVHGLVWAGGWGRDDIEAAVRGSADCGYDLLEVPAMRAASLDAGLTKAIASEARIATATSLGLSLDADISSTQSEVAARGKAALMDSLAFTHAIGARHMCGVLFSAIAKYPGPPSPANRRAAVAALQEVATAAGDKGVTLCLEVVNRYESNLLNTAGQAMELLADINRDNVGVHLDTYHMNIEEDGMEQAVATCGDRLAYVHIGESHRGYLGTGNIDFDAFFKALARASYKGPITFESFSSAVVSEDLSNNLCVWRNLWQDSHDLARQARQFIDTRWKAALKEA